MEWICILCWYVDSVFDIDKRNTVVLILQISVMHFYA